ncbi:hypothetical protein [Phormidium sp. CCY1219]|uniref:hypothetical protein n=1 Tax=Phormidium sp. CCY1219 TaxID=2886104 RepID=UPI002D1E81EE|nr:hypothetical protein [Phormidium sp. CCY1219]MEB3830832.1 hypothetical protein [Phormidium sp. CCY1219]
MDSVIVAQCNSFDSSGQWVFPAIATPGWAVDRSTPTDPLPAVTGRGFIAAT